MNGVFLLEKIKGKESGSVRNDCVIIQNNTAQALGIQHCSDATDHLKERTNFRGYFKLQSWRKAHS